MCERIEEYECTHGRALHDRAINIFLVLSIFMEQILMNNSYIIYLFIT